MLSFLTKLVTVVVTIWTSIDGTSGSVSARSFPASRPLCRRPSSWRVCLPSGRRRAVAAHVRSPSQSVAARHPVGWSPRLGLRPHPLAPSATIRRQPGKTSQQGARGSRVGVLPRLTGMCTYTDNSGENGGTGDCSGGQLS